MNFSTNDIDYIDNCINYLSEQKSNEISSLKRPFFRNIVVQWHYYWYSAIGIAIVGDKESARKRLEQGLIKGLCFPFDGGDEFWYLANDKSAFEKLVAKNQANFQALCKKNNEKPVAVIPSNTKAILFHGRGQNDDLFKAQIVEKFGRLSNQAYCVRGNTVDFNEAFSYPDTAKKREDFLNDTRKALKRSVKKELWGFSEGCELAVKFSEYIESISINLICPTPDALVSLSKIAISTSINVYLGSLDPTIETQKKLINDGLGLKTDRITIMISPKIGHWIDYEKNYENHAR